MTKKKKLEPMSFGDWVLDRYFLRIRIVGIMLIAMVLTAFGFGILAGYLIWGATL